MPEENAIITKHAMEAFVRRTRTKIPEAAEKEIRRLLRAGKYSIPKESVAGMRGLRRRILSYEERAILCGDWVLIVAGPENKSLVKTIYSLSRDHWEEVEYID